MHPRIVVNEVCFPALPMAQQIAWWQQAGVDRVGLARFRRPGRRLAAGRSCRTRGWDRDRLPTARSDVSPRRPVDLGRVHCSPREDLVDAACTLGVPTIYTTTGPKGRLSFEDAAEALATAFAPVRHYAHDRGVTVLVETANPLFAHTHFLHTLADTIAVAKLAGLGVCLDIHATWTESSLDTNIAAAGPTLGLVQISDFVPGKLTVTRDVLGEGVVRSSS